MLVPLRMIIQSFQETHEVQVKNITTNNIKTAENINENIAKPVKMGL